jgi:hypothetical protein
VNRAISQGLVMDEVLRATTKLLGRLCGGPRF